FLSQRPSLSTASHPLSLSNATATPEIYPLSLHDALPICERFLIRNLGDAVPIHVRCRSNAFACTHVLTSRFTAHVFPKPPQMSRSEEHTSELQSRENLVCRLLLEKKNDISTGSTSCSAAP